MGLHCDIVRRGAVYYFRRRLPTHARQSLHRSHMVFSLRTRRPVTARRRAARASHAFEERFDMTRSIDDFTEGDLKAVADCALYGYIEQHEAQRAVGDHPSLDDEDHWRATMDESIASVRHNLKRNQLAYGPDDAALLLDRMAVGHTTESTNFKRLARMLERATLQAFRRGDQSPAARTHRQPAG